MPIRVLPGEPHDGRTAPFLERLARAARGIEPPGKFLYLVRTALRQKLLRESVLEKTGGGFGVPIQELPAWALSLSEYLPDRKPLAGEMAARFLSERAVLELAGEKGSFFAKAVHLPNLPARLAGLMGELKRGGISSGRMLPPEIARFFDLFEEIRREAGIDTPDDRIAALAPAIRAGKLPKERLPREIALEGFYEISPVGLELLRAVSDAGCDVTFLIDTSGKEEPWTRLPEELLGQLLKGNPLLASPSSPASGGGPKRGSLLQILSLLSPDAEKRKTPSPPWLHLRLQEDSAPAGEIETIARKIRGLAASDPSLDLSGVGVVFCDVAEAAPLVRETFTRLGIPYDLAEEENLPSSPPGIAAGAALSLLRENLSRRTVRRAFSQGLLVFRPEGALSGKDLGPWNASRLDGLAREAALLDDETNWEDRLDSLLSKKRGRFEALAEENALSAFDLERERERAPREIQEIEGLRESFVALRSEKDHLFPSRRMDGRSFAAALRDWFHLLRLPRRIARLAELSVGRTGAPLAEIERRGLSERERLLRRDAAAWKRLEKLLSEFAGAAQTAGALSRPPAEWAVLFTKLLEEEKFLEEPYGQGTGRVRVMGRLDLRQLSFEHLFVAGLNEGEFPTRRRPDPFLSDPARRALGLPTQERSAAEADHLLALAFFSAKKSLHLSAPRGTAGEERLPAPALLELSRYLSSPGDRPVPTPTGLEWAQERLGRELSGGESLQWGPAVLQELKRQGGLLAPPHALARCQSVWERARRDGLSSYDGIMEGPATLAALSRLFENHVFSAGQFETYARCPIQYFFRYALGVESPEEPLREFTVLDRGRLLHRILQRYYEGEGAKHLRELWHGAPEEILSKALSSLSRIAREEVDSAGLSLVEREVYLELLLGGAADGNEKGLLGRLLAFEREDLGGAFEPGFAEKGFGRRWGTEAVELDGPKGLKPLLLNGSVDRVDLLAAPGKGFRLFDYKTGSMNDARRAMAEGLYFQLPLYGLAIEKLLGEGHAFLGGAYYVVNEEKGAKTEEALCAKEDAKLLGIKRARSFLAETREDLGRFVRRVRDRAFEIRGHILQGRFHPTIHGPAAAKCAYCAYRFACRVDHERMDSLDAEGLGLLGLLDDSGEESR